MEKLPTITFQEISSGMIWISHAYNGNRIFYKFSCVVFPIEYLEFFRNWYLPFCWSCHHRWHTYARSLQFILLWSKRNFLYWGLIDEMWTYAVSPRTLIRIAFWTIITVGLNKRIVIICIPLGWVVLDVFPDSGQFFFVADDMFVIIALP